MTQAGLELTDNKVSFGGKDSFLPHLINEINEASSIDLAVSFVKMSGLRLILPALIDASERGIPIRIITSDYLQITDPAALSTLNSLSNIDSYLFSSTKSFHVKSYIFCHHDDGTGIAYVGSSNLSYSALNDAFEWNLGIAQNKDPHTFDLICKAFEALLANQQCHQLNELLVARYQASYQQGKATQFNVAESDVDHYQHQITDRECTFKPHDIQLNALEALKKSRMQGFRRGLVVMATGTGKTWLSAFDVQEIAAKSVLFIAHREEILLQAQSTYGELFPQMSSGLVNAKTKQLDSDIIFASVMTLGKEDFLSKFAPDRFDYIVVDEFHHASAKSYQGILNYFKPNFLLGLTATPQRTDNANILALCDNNLVYQIDMPSAIAEQILVPFRYYGIKDTVDYSEISWRNGKFDPQSLNNAFSTSLRAKHNFENWKKYRQSRTLAFCISQKHAVFMAEYFILKGIKAVAVYAGSETPRNVALKQLEQGAIEVIFAVDLFNEGTDLPSIDTILMLRPTESKIIYLQQIGRGLRRSTYKKDLVIVDFIGNHTSYFNKFESLFAAGASNESRQSFLKHSHDVELENGCYINLELDTIDMLEQLIKTSSTVHETLYNNLSSSLGRRPSLSEFVEAGGDLKKLRHHSQFWFNFVAKQTDDDINLKPVVESNAQFLAELEKTAMTRTFKMLLLKAFLEEDGFVNGVNLDNLCERSWYVFQRHPSLIPELTKTLQKSMGKIEYPHHKFKDYWTRNPINAWTGGNLKNPRNAFFTLQDNVFKYKQHMNAEHADTLNNLVLELIDYRLTQYERRR